MSAKHWRISIAAMEQWATTSEVRHTATAHNTMEWWRSQMMSTSTAFALGQDARSRDIGRANRLSFIINTECRDRSSRRIRKHQWLAAAPRSNRRDNDVVMDVYTRYRGGIRRPASTRQTGPPFPRRWSFPLWPSPSTSDRRLTVLVATPRTRFPLRSIRNHWRANTDESRARARRRSKFEGT